MPVELVEPPGGLGSDEYKRIAPIGKIPVLDVDGELIAESEVIQEYLEDRFPQPSLRGATPEQAAAIRVFSRITDLYFLPPLQALRTHTRSGAHGPVDAAVTDALNDALSLFESFLQAGNYAVGNTLSFADCAMAPLVGYLVRFAKAADIPPPISNFQKLAAWQTSIGQDATVARALAEIATAVGDS